MGASHERPTGQLADGTWEIGVRRTLPVSPGRAWELLASSRGLDVELVRGNAFATGDGIRGTVRSVTPETVARLSFEHPDWPAPSTLQLRVIPVASGTTIAVHHERLPDANAREEMRERWAALLDAFAESA